MEHECFLACLKGFTTSLLLEGEVGMGLGRRPLLREGMKTRLKVQELNELESLRMARLTSGARDNDP